MKSDELKKLVSSGESENLEFKRSTGQRSQATKTVCAMLNGLGGFVLFGVGDTGRIRGQKVSSKTLEDIARELRRIEPPAFPDMETITLEDGNAVIALRVSGGGGPYTYDGRPYIRQGPATEIMPQQRYERLLLERMHGSHRWENQIAAGFSIDDLDEAEIIRTVKEAIRRNRLDASATQEPEDMLRGLGLTIKGELLNAAMVLFARSESLLPGYPQCLLKMARLRGPGKTEFDDIRQKYGNAFAIFKWAQQFYIDHLPVAAHFPPGSFEREDEPLYPTEALREALANAICHRDYSIAGGCVSIAIYDDRLEISSDGILPFGLTPEELFRPHRSLPWNPLIARAFYLRGIIETWGRGTLRMREVTLAAGLPEPEIRCGTGEVSVVFRPSESRLHRRMSYPGAESARVGKKSLGSFFRGAGFQIRQWLEIRGKRRYSDK
ncbi:ATP-binding protein [Desulfonema magnum]|uniref:Schlafen AAA domain-containing protein n=1 Tax=Desulfonema magnum TaxID=45655 RepID=A0A975BF37_9BACT|nr:ATP-binding protein [Desulfonema magnum]QTA84216.1 Schlafen AAA domain-containing protein [Desulfonema magnum]